MKNPALYNCILRILRRLDTGLKEETLAAETTVAMDNPRLTTGEFGDALQFLADKALVESFPNLIGEKCWGITELGRQHLRELEG